ncbi:Long-chain-fatty-acid--CoA ligase [Amycolatopsis aidingensis]|uniref:Long-chain-fatty-acid--CoA ligase n=1 Tax=Amycolatopsis aidingensis TaxID=2842453 RepID=UPI001C0B433D|nr:Long-chain-fatty-acid--CoA ligase [Amycolatopsis aidingensis]
MLVENLASRPDLLEPALALGDVGAEFAHHDQIGTLTRARRLARRWPEYFLVLLDGDEPVARAASVPLVFPDADRAELPDHGWDGAVLWAVEDALDERLPTALVALDVQVVRERRGKGIAGEALLALREVARARGLSRMVVPVRPTGKPDYPRLSMPGYVALRREDGLPEDAWLRTHERLGAWFVRIAPFAMTVTGSVGQWRSWTGRSFVDGPNVVSGGLAPVLVSLEQDLGVYVEPNVWYEHPLV